MAKLQVVFVHGISKLLDQNIKYTADLRENLVRQLKEWSILDDDATNEEVNALINFSEVDYSDINADHEEYVRKSYDEDRKHLYGPIDRLLGRLALDPARTVSIVTTADMLLYQSDYWRKELRRRMFEALNPFAASGDAVSVVAHGLGSVIAFDVAYYNCRHNPDWKNFKLANFFTLGSPLALFSLELDAKTGKPKSRYQPMEGTTKQTARYQFVLEDGVWYNFLDAQDIAAYPLDAYFKDKFLVEDLVVQLGTDPIRSHTGYWSNVEIAERIAQCLKFDHDRLNKRG
jgi:hypothetical protein